MTRLMWYRCLAAGLLALGGMALMAGCGGGGNGNGNGDPTPPPAPTNLRVTAVTSTQINVAWDYGAASVTGFEVQRKSNPDWTTVSTLGASARQHSSTGLTPATSYSFRVRAIRDALTSAWSGEVTQATDPVPTATVTGRVVSSASGAPVRGASVTLGSQGTTTNDLGQFTFSGFPVGTHTLNVSASGFLVFTPRAETIVAGSNDLGDVELTPDFDSPPPPPPI
jgi:hypothetical protein